MGPQDHKGRSVLDEHAIELLAMTVSSQRKHKDPNDLAKDMTDTRDVLMALTASSYMLVPQGLIESMINNMRDLLMGTGMT
jgi:hypothetical protein